MMTDWNPDDKTLSSTAAPFEGTAAFRMYRNGINSQEIMRRLKLRGTQYLKIVEDDKVREAVATQKGLPVHDGLIPKGTE